MSEFKKIQLQIAELQKKAEDARKSELATVIADIKAKIKEYELTPADIGLKGALKVAKPVTTVAPKYRDPKTGATWTGRGKAPLWLAESVRAGKATGYLISVQEQKAAEKAEKAKQAPAVKVAPSKGMGKKEAAKKVAAKKIAAKKVAEATPAPEAASS